MYMKKCLSKEEIIEYSGFGFGVFDEVCLLYQTFCFIKIFRKIHAKVVTKMIQYSSITKNSSPVGRK